jgi:hypothetical protein
MLLSGARNKERRVEGLRGCNCLVTLPGARIYQGLIVSQFEKFEKIEKGENK